MNDAPIGIFDSGVGGLTVARSILDQLPHESILYIGDTAHAPYGPRPLADVRALALSVMDRLVDEGVKMLVIACNSASAAVLRDARERYTIGRGIPVPMKMHSRSPQAWKSSASRVPNLSLSWSLESPRGPTFWPSPVSTSPLSVRPRLTPSCSGAPITPS